MCMTQPQVQLLQNRRNTYTGNHGSGIAGLPRDESAACSKRVYEHMMHGETLNTYLIAERLEQNWNDAITLCSGKCKAG